MSHLEAKLKDAYGLIKSGDFFSAQECLSNAIVDELEDEELLFALRCVNFWRDIAVFDDDCAPNQNLARVDSIFFQWGQFCAYISAERSRFLRCFDAVNSGVFFVALRNCQSAVAPSEPPDGLVCQKIGLCCKKLGDYDSALKYFSAANSLLQNSAELLAEMADCYAFCGEDATSKVLFREAFFIDASKVDLDFLDSPLICNLVEQIRSEKKCPPDEFLEWIPVYGALFGVFNVRRELRAVEIGKLQLSIVELENQMRTVGSNPEILRPRLINRYFWLLDHYVRLDENRDGENREKINGILLKIKVLDLNVYNRYINGGNGDA